MTAATTYTLKSGDNFATVSTELSNSGSAALKVWTGDAMDHDAAGQASVIPGAGTVTPGAAVALAPTKPYIGMTGTDPQVFGLVYGTPVSAFDVYAAGNWVMSRSNVDVPAGGSVTFTRKLVVTPGADTVGILDGVSAPYRTPTPPHGAGSGLQPGRPGAPSRRNGETADSWLPRTLSPTGRISIRADRAWCSGSLRMPPRRPPWGFDHPMYRKRR